MYSFIGPSCISSMSEKRESKWRQSVNHNCPSYQAKPFSSDLAVNENPSAVPQLSMKTLLQCPSCQSKRFYSAPAVNQNPSAVPQLSNLFTIAALLFPALRHVPHTHTQRQSLNCKESEAYPGIWNEGDRLLLLSPHFPQPSPFLLPFRLLNHLCHVPHTETVSEQ